MPQSFADVLSWVPKGRQLAASLARAHDYARAQGHRAVTLEHLLLALTDDGDAAAVLKACRVPVQRMSAEVSSHLARLPSAQIAEPEADPDLVRILDYAVAAAQQSRRREVNGAIVLAALVGEGRSQAAAILRAHGLTFEAAIEAIQRAGASAAAKPQPSRVNAGAAAPEMNGQPWTGPMAPLPPVLPQMGPGDVAAAALPQGLPATGAQRPAGGVGFAPRAAPPLDPVQLVEGIPRRMRVGRPEVVEIRVAKASLASLDADAESAPIVPRLAAPVTRAVTMRLRGRHGEFAIEMVTPETQWVEDTLGLLTDDYASWRWVVTPQRRGRRRLHILLAARSAGPGGLGAETGLPEQTITVRVRSNKKRKFGRLLLWLAAVGIGAFLAKFGEGLWPYVETLVRRALGL